MAEEKFVPNLVAIIDDIEDNVPKIAANWMKNSSVKSVFEIRKISPVKFREGYGVPIIGYFIAVVRGKETLGDCPIMSKLVDYLITKGITPREVFDICIGFRRSLIAFLLRKEKVLKNPAVFMEEVATVFDANLSGVLEKFTTLYAESQKKIELAKAQKSRLSQTLNIINSMDTKIIIIKQGRIIVANKPFLAMVGVVNLKELYERYERGFEFLSDVSLYEKEFKEDITLWLEKIFEHNRPFKSTIHNYHKDRTFEYSLRVSKITDESNQFVITFTNITEYIKDRELLEDELKYDEITGFRNFITFEQYVSEAIQKAKNEKTRLFLALIDIVDFEKVKEEKDADMVVSEVAEDLRYLVDSSVHFGKLDEDRFAVLMEYPNEQSSYDWCVNLLQKLNERESRKTVAVTEVDMAESINRLFLRVYDLIERANHSEEKFIVTDFKDVIEYIELPEQKAFTDRLDRMKSLKMTLFYKELPLQSDIKIVGLGQESVNVILSQKQSRVVYEDMEVYFKLQQIGNIKARIKSVDLKTNIATIYRFRLDKDTPLNRKMFRVAVDQQIKAFVTSHNIDYDVEI